MSLKEKLKKIQSKSRKSKAAKAKRKVAKEKKDLAASRKRTREYAKREYSTHVKELEEKAAKKPDAEELSIDADGSGGYFAECLAKLFKKDGMKCEVTSYTCENYYGTGPHTFYSLRFKL